MRAVYTPFYKTEKKLQYTKRQEVINTYPCKKSLRLSTVET